MTQIKTSRPPNPNKQTGQGLSVGEVNELNNVVNANAQDFTDRAAAVASSVSASDSSLTTIEGTSIPIKTHTTSLPSTAANGTIALNPVNNIMMYRKNGSWYKIKNGTLANLENFKIKVDTGATTTFQLPLVSGRDYNFDIDWGDGNFEVISSDTQLVHDYGTTGIYTITMNGAIPGFAFNNGGDKDKLIEIVESGGLSFVSTGQTALKGCSNLTTIDNTQTFKTEGVGSFLEFYRDCSSLTQVPLMDTTSATTVARMFQDCTLLTAVPDYDFGTPTDISSLFYRCSNLSGVGNITIDSSNITNFSSLFFLCLALQNSCKWDMSNATTLSNMFRACFVLSEIPTNPQGGVLNTSNVSNFDQAFRDCRIITTFPLIDTGGGTTFSRTWGGCWALTEMPLIDMSSAVGINNTWDTAKSLTIFPEMDFSSGTSFTNAWHSCSLNMTSVENILKSLVATGKTGLTTSIGGNPGTGYTTTIGISQWTTNADPTRDALTNYNILTYPLGSVVPNTALTGRGWTVTTRA